MFTKYKSLMKYIPVLNIFVLIYYLIYAARMIRKRFQFVLFVFLFGFSASIAQNIALSYQKPIINWLVLLYVCYFMPLIMCIAAEKTMFTDSKE